MIMCEKPTVRWVRITKTRAQERWAKGEAITLVPCRCSPGSPFHFETTVHLSTWRSRARTISRQSTLWAGSVNKTAWNLMYRAWEHYTCHELGYYAHYYIAKPLKETHVQDHLASST